MLQFLIALHTFQNHTWRCILKQTKNIYMRNDNVSIMNTHPNVKIQYVWVTLTRFAFLRKHVTSECINSWLRSIHCKTICEDISPNTQKSFTCEKTMFSSWIRIQMSKHNMFETHWPNLPSSANMSNLNLSIDNCSPCIAIPYVKMYP